MLPRLFFILVLLRQKGVSLVGAFLAIEGRDVASQGISCPVEDLVVGCD